MYVDDVCMWGIVAIGAITGRTLQRRLGCMGWTVFGVFVIAADARLYWLQQVVVFGLRKLGWWESVARHSAWSVSWTMAPVLILAILGLCIVGDAKRANLSPPNAATSREVA